MIWKPRGSSRDNGKWGLREVRKTENSKKARKNCPEKRAVSGHMDREDQVDREKWVRGKNEDLMHG